ncbi:hypothetical protein SYNPS1DRAFT_26301 [Syncephalis pseudoplumigaleata]|uniref:Uncharacterized protein n=1 Tax=Syncephalis pseudoplumigaleata TaxID=1712513 RepID=A0A4P9Z7D8_9FUNG|nr:hypothetical protein SYNPS1DRAFT_26301 [Syncephalis pseudoplumigaleata]|eukprot:RKP28112.1 hypothetical protein SYNPS1DRAFT_26301 [Syncephalis pseudoplumigaleata]
MAFSAFSRHRSGSPLSLSLLPFPVPLSIMEHSDSSATPSASIEVVIIVLHIFSFMGAICVCYTQAKLQRWFIARYSAVMVLYHLSQLVHLTLYGVMMVGAPAAACFTRRTVALYAPRAMQIFAAGFACRIWRAVIRQETGLFHAHDSWKRIDRWTCWLAYTVPVLPAVLGMAPQLATWADVRKTSVYDCRYAYSVRWQLVGADGVWAIPPTVVCLGMLVASAVQFFCQWGGLLRFVDARLLPINVSIRLLVVCINIGVAGVFHIYLTFHEYASVSGDAWSPAAPDPHDWPADVRQSELVRQMVGDMLSSMLGILDFFAFATDSDSLRILSGHCGGAPPDDLAEERFPPIILHARMANNRSAGPYRHRTSNNTFEMEEAAATAPITAKREEQGDVAAYGRFKPSHQQQANTDEAAMEKKEADADNDEDADADEREDYGPFAPLSMVDTADKLSYRSSIYLEDPYSFYGMDHPYHHHHQHYHHHYDGMPYNASLPHVNAGMPGEAGAYYHRRTATTTTVDAVRAAYTASTRPARPLRRASLFDPSTEVVSSVVVVPRRSQANMAAPAPAVPSRAPSSSSSSGAPPPSPHSRPRKLSLAAVGRYP